MVKKLETIKLIASSEKAARKTHKKIWGRLVEELSKPTRGKVEVNIDSINKMAQKNKGKILLVPGKLLSRGILNQKVTVVAVNASSSAQEKIKSQKGEFISLKEFVLTPEKVETKNLVIVK
ncbi:MAG: 50S ribosomal protein L18e [Candidatus ainarchaeum sp.]|jgi:ribosomal protein L18E|nr:50S ribosomal protein L18e [Candidatus ainarchaeum sp.]MDD3085744.1 50S ribosomal protein L18e [Candidatus ainarchaeum sp.]MDD4128477.1 50S ribosomal protein L18e [Candidatus ainarchaeum sp.]MDD4467880.1 50S ribosomal protein L18e [Candidatus ainarchaeum sp.]HPM85532.1 50S ribosomal protein L18e [archaeon]